MLDARQIQEILPHRYPFLLVDRILELEENERAVGVKNVTVNEEFFQGHFPGRPIMPGVLILEAMAQVGGVMLLDRRQRLAPMLPFLGPVDFGAGIEGVPVGRPENRAQRASEGKPDGSANQFSHPSPATALLLHQRLAAF